MYRDKSRKWTFSEIARFFTVLMVFRVEWIRFEIPMHTFKQTQMNTPKLILSGRCEVDFVGEAHRFESSGSFSIVDVQYVFGKYMHQTIPFEAYK